MIQQNSPTLTGMISTIKPGVGNLYTQPVNPAGFQTPYPSPQDIAIQQQMMMYQQRPYMHPAFNVPPPPGTVTSFMANGVPVELEYRPEYFPQGSIYQSMPQTSFVQVPGAPQNPDFANVQAQPASAPPGRYFNVPQSVPGYAEHLRARQKLIESGGTPKYPPLTPQSTFAQTRPQNNQFPPVVGRVDYYNGQPVHPHVHDGWYGSATEPFVRTATTDPMSYGGWAGVQQRTTITREQQDMANLAAYHGFTYEQWIRNACSTLQTMSRCCSRYYGLSEEETEKRASQWEIKDVDPSTGHTDEELFYPPGAFGMDGQLTNEYIQTFCVNREFIKKVRKIRVIINYVDEEGEVIKSTKCIPTGGRKNNWNKDTMLTGSIERTKEYNQRVEEYRKNLYAQMHENAPEREFDHSDYSAFQIVGRTLNKAYQKDLEDLAYQQAHARAANSYSTGGYVDTLSVFYQKAKAAKEEARSRKFSKLIDAVIPDSKLPEIQADLKRRAREGPPYIMDGDWVIAKPGVDIVGVPLDRSVNKIIRMNRVTGEEEIYNPDKPLGLFVRQQVKNSVERPNFTDEDANDERSSKFRESGWQS